MGNLRNLSRRPAKPALGNGRVQRRATATAAKSTDPATGRVDRASLNQATPLLGPLRRDLEQEG
jgi:hypothetical protein